MPSETAETPDIARLLAESRARTEQRVAELSAVLASIVDASDRANLDDEHDPEGATIGFERAQVSALLERAQSRLVEIDDARERERAGTFGMCEQCGDAIPDARLAAQPATRACVSCAST